MKIRRKHGSPVRMRIRRDRYVPGLWIQAGPLVGTMTPEDAIALVHQIIDTLDKPQEPKPDAEVAGDRGLPEEPYMFGGHGPTEREQELLAGIETTLRRHGPREQETDRG